MNFRIGNGVDCHQLTPNKKLILGGVLIESDLETTTILSFCSNNDLPKLRGTRSLSFRGKPICLIYISFSTLINIIIASPNACSILYTIIG